ncbi:hypothetical protein [Sporichthya sp.]|uniref:hypothetical protein n=1 Tax=Sporichthya sp. TaxID=65475 RepID=UPI00184F4BB6|nr:hypothetical protein [Sporichthya sp.]MBA3742187.1 hypothetical protein [Sporichthya sp.]
MAQEIEEESLLVYARAIGGSTPPLLMNPPPDWTVKFFTKKAPRSLYVKLAGDVSAYRFSDGAKLDPESTLGELNLLPYELIEFRSDG